MGGDRVEVVSKGKVNRIFIIRHLQLILTIETTKMNRISFIEM